jgi:hypothetical protein
MSRKRIFLTVPIAIALAGAVAGWVYYVGAADAARHETNTLRELDAEDIGLLVKSQTVSGDGELSTLLDSPERRRAFLRGLREHLALAAAARNELIDEDPDFTVNLGYKSNLLLADLYQSKLKESPDETLEIADDEISAVLAVPENASAFERDMETLRRIQNAANENIGNGIRLGVLAGEGLKRVKAKWARAKIVSDLAKQDTEFINSRAVTLRLQVLEAGLLSTHLLQKNYPARIKATPAEIDRFITERPEYSIESKRKKAEDILTRVRRGEDISKLAALYSEHRPSRKTGGLIENVMAGDQPAELESELLRLKPGQTAEHVIETELGFHVARLEAKLSRKMPDGRTIPELTFRQVLFQKQFEQPGVGNSEIPAPFMTAEEIARMLIEKEKRDAYVSELVAANPVSLPDDFEIGEL